jgi:hypothetical protein
VIAVLRAVKNLNRFLENQMESLDKVAPLTARACKGPKVRPVDKPCPEKGMLE